MLGWKDAAGLGVWLGGCQHGGVEVPDVSYARSWPLSIAYQVVGDGAGDVLWVRGGLDDMLSSWERPEFHEFMGELTVFARVLLFDKRGSGLSDPAIGGFSLEARMDDIRAVMDAAGSSEAVLLGVWEGARLALLFAATYPERTRGLVLVDAAATQVRSPEHPWGSTTDELNAEVRDARERWGRREYFAEWLAEELPPGVDPEELFEWEVRRLRRAASPSEAAEFWRAANATDVTDILASVRVPTTVIRHAREPGPTRFLAERIAGARFVEVPSTGGMLWLLWPERRQKIIGEIRALSETEPAEADNTVLATILFTDLVGSTQLAASIGDKAWKDLVQQHHAIVRQQLARFRGTEVETAGDGFFATFDGPARAIRCAEAIVARVAEIGLDVRAGLHTGECEISDGKIAGIAVNIGARVSALAGPREVLVTSTVRDLVGGSGLRFEDHGEHTLKGVPSSWRLYRLLGEDQHVTV
jgi:class 3 adenylate cyclase/pimeloyl-ACP methyl ester carboxylesterase